MARPEPISVPPVARIGASVSDLDMVRLNLPSRLDVVEGSPTSLTPSLSKSCHIVASAKE